MNVGQVVSNKNLLNPPELLPIVFSFSSGSNGLSERAKFLAEPGVFGVEVCISLVGITHASSFVYHGTTIRLFILANNLSSRDYQFFPNKYTLFINSFIFCTFSLINEFFSLSN